MGKAISVDFAVLYKLTLQFNQWRHHFHKANCIL